MTLKDTTDDLFEARFPLPSNAGARFEKPRNKDWILSPAQKRAAWRRTLLRSVLLVAVLVASPVAMDAVGVMPASAKEFVCLGLDRVDMPVAGIWCETDLRVAFRD